MVGKPICIVLNNSNNVISTLYQNINEAGVIARFINSKTDLLIKSRFNYYYYSCSIAFFQHLWHIAV